MSRPKYINKYGDNDLKLGIKSSLPNVKATIALGILLWESNECPAILTYSVKSGKEIVIDSSVAQFLVSYVSDVLDKYHINKDKFIEKVNLNQLFKSQLESLIVAFELIWRLARVLFADETKNASAERTGGERFPKKFTFSSNMDIIHSLICTNEEEYKKVLLFWLGIDEIPYNSVFNDNLLHLLTALSEQAVFKLSTGEQDINFNQCGIYQALLESDDSVNIDDIKENKGPLRILKSMLSDKMNPYLDESDHRVVAAVSDEKLSNYNIRVDTLLQLSSIDLTDEMYKTEEKEDFVLNDSSEQEQLFKQWLGKQYKSNGELLAVTTVNRDYPNALKNGYKQFKKYNEKPNFFQIQSLNDLDAYKSYLSTEPAFNKDTFRNFNSGLVKYREFLTDSSACENLHGYNKIYYGIPGCGKSYHIEHEVLKNVDKENNVFRTTFYLDYSNSDFIGQIYPQADEEGNVTYDYKPGPFTSALERAYSTDKMVYLVIEEINRGNAAAILGDTFQLLDRLTEDFDERFAGDSEYPINNQFIEEYLKRQKVEIPEHQNKIFIPHNLTILATMNTSDQNVFPLDTAFKRRWQRERVVASIEDCEFKDNYIPYTDVTWNDFVTGINYYIITHSADGMVLEDKQMGPFFASKDMFIDKSLNDKTDEDSKKEKNNALKKFVYNVIDYLYNDVCKFDKEYLFKGNISFNAICEYAEKGDNIIELCFKDRLFDNDSKDGQHDDAVDDAVIDNQFSQDGDNEQE